MIKQILILLPLSIVLLLTYCTEPLVPEPDMEMEEEEEEEFIADPRLENGSCPDTLSPFYIESGGLVVIEAESAIIDGTDWQVDSTLTGFSNLGYIVWKGNDFFNLPGRGVLTYKIRITETGRYRFVWKSRITQGSSFTDFNDSWLRIADADHFYGQKGNGDIVYPKGSNQDPIEESSGQGSTVPEGAGSNGWFKVYMNTVGSWHWRATTSDNDPHQIYVVFDEAGDYTIEISGRSFGHGIDRFILFNDNFDFANVTNDSRELSEVMCE